MVRNAKDVKDLEHVSFSFIPSLKCNNQCSFCMYGASPDNKQTLSYDTTAKWMKSVVWDRVIGWGLYGGEPFIEMQLYERFYQLLPEELPKFVITNGTWSKSDTDAKNFLQWSVGKFHIVVSGTTEHRRHQSVNFIKKLARQFDGAITYKDEYEEMHPMGRLSKPDWNCLKKCLWHETVTRLAIFVTGHIILQNCDGVYPVIGHIEQMGFAEAFEKGRELRTIGCDRTCMNINDLQP